MPLPFSDVPAFRRDPLTLLSRRAQSAPPGFVPLHLSNSRIFLASDPQLARATLKWSSDEIDKGSLVQKLKPIMGNSLLTNIGPAHRRSKDAIHLHLQRNSLSANLEKMCVINNGYIARLAKENSFVTTQESAPLALQLGCTAIFGHDVLSAADRAALIKAVQIVEGELADDMFRLWPAMPWTSRKRTQQLDHARSIVSLVVTRARANDQRSGLLRALEEAELSDTEIDAEILGLLIAGHHTTGATMGWLFYHLAVDPSISEIIALEADTVLDDLENGDASALRRAPLSLAYVKEVLRLYPAGWWTSREVLKPLAIGNHSFKRGDAIMVSPWQLHHDPRFWDEPERLMLDRDFTSDAYMPFGVGPRSCIGMAIAWFELQLVVLQFASAFSFSVANSASRPKPHPSVTLLAPPVELRIGPRTDRKNKSRAA